MLHEDIRRAGLEQELTALLLSVPGDEALEALGEVVTRIAALTSDNAWYRVAEAVGFWAEGTETFTDEEEDGCDEIDD
jgi:hypothetical protein